MTLIDWLVLAGYFAAMVGVGAYFRKRAAANLEAYFLAGKRLPWPALAMSGAVSNFDITGTMWMVSVLYLLGMRSWWHHWMWGVALPAFALAYLAVWVRRSRVLTAAEWMRTRFGDDAGGRCARYATALMAVLFTAAMIGYAFQGIGKFASVYLPLGGVAAFLPDVLGDFIIEHHQHILAIAVFTVTTFYVVAGGLFSVVVTDVVQTVILTAGAIFIAAMAYARLSPELIASSTPEDFTSLMPVWRMERLGEAGQGAEYEMFGLLTIAWIAKGLLMNAGGPSQQYDFQRFLAARSVRDASKVAAAWPFFLVVRWAMVMAIALLATTGLVNETDPERVMPAVLKTHLPTGVRGLIVAGLLAAFMSTFSSTVNAGAAFIVRDLWQPLIDPNADERRLIRVSYFSTVGIVLAGIAIGWRAGSIAQIWNWVMMALVAAVIVPNVLRWHWWRLNGWGFSAGVGGGLVLSLAALFRPDLPIYVTFPAICIGSLVATVAVSLLTEPTRADVLADFYRNVRPWGFWGPVRQANVSGAEVTASVEPPGRAIFNTVVAVIGLTGLYLAPMYLVGHWHRQAGLCAMLAVGAGVVLYFTWYRHLPEDVDEGA